MDVPRLHDAFPVDVEFGVVVADVVNAVFGRRLHRFDLQTDRRIDIREALGRRQVLVDVEVGHLEAVVRQRAVDDDVVGHDADDRAHHHVHRHQQMRFGQRDRQEVGLGPFVIGAFWRVVLEIGGSDHGGAHKHSLRLSMRIALSAVPDKRVTEQCATENWV